MSTALLLSERMRHALCLTTLALLAEEGSGLELEVTAFVPRHRVSLDQDQPLAIMGLWRCLEKIRFAVDPSSDTFYFGTLGDEAYAGVALLRKQ